MMAMLILNGVEVTTEQYHGVGKLNVQTERGELQAQHGDFLCKFPDGYTVVLPERIVEQVGGVTTLEELLAETTDANPPALPVSDIVSVTGADGKAKVYDEFGFEVPS